MNGQRQCERVEMRSERTIKYIFYSKTCTPRPGLCVRSHEHVLILKIYQVRSSNHKLSYWFFNTNLLTVWQLWIRRIWIWRVWTRRLWRLLRSRILLNYLLGVGNYWVRETRAAVSIRTYQMQFSENGDHERVATIGQKTGYTLRLVRALDVLVEMGRTKKGIHWITKCNMLHGTRREILCKNSLL